jgi:hypothetical protein
MSKNVDEKSDNVVLPTKPSNKEGSPSAETVEGRTLPEGNSQQTTVGRTQSRVSTSSGLLAVRQAAQARKDVRFSALLHHIDVELLEQSYFALKRKAAPGIDGVRCKPTARVSTNRSKRYTNGYTGEATGPNPPDGR